MEGYFGEPDRTGKRKVFRLELDKKSKLNNMQFNDFSEADKRKFKGFVLRAIKIRQLHPKDDNSSMYQIFERLNTGGTLLRPQEIRNCIFRGKFNDLLLKLNEYSNWRKLLGWMKLGKHQKDVEFILRYSSLFHDAPKYEKPMKVFMSNFMTEHKNPTEEFLNDEETRFKKTCDSILTHLGERPFILQRNLVIPVLESIFVAFAKNLDKIPSNISERYKLLKQNDHYVQLCRRATTDEKIVHDRLALCEQILFK